MMAEPNEYQVTARKWRPAEFASVVGQEHVTQTLKNAIRSERLHHAYLFSGPRGVGKTTTARILAKALNCTDLGDDLEPCGACGSCREITEGRSLDVVEIDGASNNSVDDIRKLRENAKYPPVGGRYKLYIIDEVHMLSTSAFNALLKILEEPPKHLVFVFATTEPHKVPATILSRCQRFDFRRMQIADIVGRLAYIASQEGFDIEEDALVVIAKKGDGSMRDSQSIFDQVTSFCGRTVTYARANEALNIIDQGFFFRVTDMMRSHASSEAFLIVEEVMRVGYDPQEFLIGLAEHLRNFLTVMTTNSTRLIEAAKMYLDRYGEEAATMEQGDMIRALHLTLAAQQAIRISSQPRLRLELAMVQLAVMDSTVNLTQLLEKIDRLPDGGGGGKAIAPRSAPAVAGPVSSEAAVPKQTYASAIKESLKGGEDTRKERSSLDNLASFPTSGPAVHGAPRQPIYTADPDTQLQARPRIDSSIFPVSEESAAGGMMVKEDVSSRGGAPVLSLRDLQGRWPQFIAFCEDKRGLSTTLQAVKPSELCGNVIRLYVSSDFEMSILNRNREVLGEKLRSFFDTPLHVEGVIGSAPTPIHRDRDPSTLAVRRGSDHPFIQSIVDLLGASRI